ncbi:MAG: hypothetical protein WC314_03475 [Vulcanimicrobiota bacterium]
MNINSLNRFGASNLLTGFNQLPGAGASGGRGSSGGGLAKTDGISLSNEARAGNASKAQQYSNKFTQDTLTAMQAQGGGDQKQGQQAVKQLENTYNQGKESGLLEQVNPSIRGLAEQLLGNTQGEQSGCQGGGEKSGGCGGGKSGGCGGGGPEQAQSGSSGGGCAKKEDENKFDKEVLDQLEKLLGKKSECSEKASGAEDRCKKNESVSPTTEKKCGQNGVDKSPSGRKSPRSTDGAPGKGRPTGANRACGGGKPTGASKKS